MSSKTHETTSTSTQHQTDETVNFGIIGYGNLGQEYADAIDNLDDIELSGVADLSPESRENARDRGLPAYESHGDLIDNEEVDVAAVIVPHKFLPGITNDLQEEGVAAFPEKPLGRNKDEIKQVIDKRDEVEGTVGIGLQKRHEHYHDIENILEEEDLGRVESIDAELYQNWIQKHNDDGNWRKNYELSGGGDCRDSWMHQLDGIFDAFGANPESVETTYIEWSADEGVESRAQAAVDLDMGTYDADGNFLMVGDADEEWREYMEVEFENGRIVLEDDHVDKDLTVKMDDGREYVIDDFEVKGGYENGTQAKIADMADAVRNASEPEAVPEDMYRTAAFVDAVYESAGTGEVVDVEMDDISYAEKRRIAAD